MNAKSPVSDHYRWSIHLLRAALESFQKSDTALIKLDMLVKKNYSVWFKVYINL